MIPQSHKYTPAIDGLRAVAVVAVIINHFNNTLLPSGYLGVDIFFVISGFVITASLVKRSEENATHFFFQFYKRRIKRLLPALLFCFMVGGTLISLVNPTPQNHLITGLFSLIGFSNIDLYLNSIDYWGESAKLNPFTHTWSLGVEEQFYFVFPMLLWFLTRGNWNSKNLKSLMWVLMLLSVLSLYFFATLSDTHQSAVYFLMPFRFWEIGLGCIIFLYANQINRVQNKNNRFIPIPFLLIALITILFLPRSYSVIATTLVVLITALLIIQIKKNEFSDRQYTGVLVLKPVLYIGQISYSLYLWHWIIIVISLWTVGITLWTVPIQCLLILMFSAISYHWIEKPLRQTSWRTSLQARSYLLTGLVVVLGSFYMLPEKANANFLYLAETSQRKPIDFDSIASDIDCNKVHVNSAGTSIRTVGNSHANHILPMLRLLSKRCGYNLIHEKHPNYIVIPSGNNEFQDKIEEVVSELKKGDILILSSRNRFLYEKPYMKSTGDFWFDHSKIKQNQGFGLEKWLQELNRLLALTQKRGINVILFLPITEFDTQVVNYNKMCQGSWFKNNKEGCNPKVSKDYLDHRFPQSFYQQVYKKATQLNHFYVFNPQPTYCAEESQQCERIVDGVVAFADTNHLSRDGSRLMLKSFSDFLKVHNLL